MAVFVHAYMCLFVGGEATRVLVYFFFGWLLILENAHFSLFLLLAESYE